MSKMVLTPILLLILLCVPSIIFSQMFSSNLAGYAEVKVSDELNHKYIGTNATDRKRKSDWISKGSENKWIHLNWYKPVNISFIKLINRQTGSYDPILHSELVFSDGTIVKVGPIKTHGRKVIRINKGKILWVKYIIHRGVNNVGLCEIVVFGKDAK